MTVLLNFRYEFVHFENFHQLLNILKNFLNFCDGFVRFDCFDNLQKLMRWLDILKNPELFRQSIGFSYHFHSCNVTIDLIFGPSFTILMVLNFFFTFATGFNVTTNFQKLCDDWFDFWTIFQNSNATYDLILGPYLTIVIFANFFGMRITLFGQINEEIFPRMEIFGD